MEATEGRGEKLAPQRWTGSCPPWNAVAYQRSLAGYHSSQCDNCIIYL